MGIFTRLDHEEVRASARMLELGDLVVWKGIEAGTVNTSYALSTANGQRYFLRVYEQQDADGARREARLLAHLSACGVRVPVPIATQSVPTGIFELAGKPAAVFPWMDGDMLCQRSVSPSALRQVGTALARVHEAGVPQGLDLDGGRFDPEQLLHSASRIDEAVCPDARMQRRPIEEALRQVMSTRSKDGPRGLIHGDLFRDNVLWSSDGTLRALLDFESASIGPYAYDLAVTFLSWCFDDELRFDLGRALCEGYAGVRPISSELAESMYDEACFATVRFTMTRIVDNAARVGKRWERFVARRKALEAAGKREFVRRLGLGA